MRIQLGNTLIEVTKVYIEEQYKECADTVPEKVYVCAAHYSNIGNTFRELKLGFFMVNGDKKVYDDCVTKYKEMIAAKMLRDGYCTFEFLGKYWNSYMPR